jgi:uncharacterized protein (TIGR02145 family)
MKKNSFYLMLALVMMSAASVNAQVLIGGTASDVPHSGAILDLTSGRNNNLGLLLPNVELSDDASEFALVPVGTATGDIKQTATGMIVYNTAYVLKGAGIYVWDGNKWIPLRDPCPNSMIDKRDGTVYCTGDFGAAGTWMTQNLRYKPEDSENFRYPNNSETIYESHPEYGLLYNWDTAKTICPTGWHLPTRDEWNSLITEIKADVAQRYSTLATPDRSRQKMTSLKWGEENTDGYSKSSYENGFDALWVGNVHPSYGALSYGDAAQYWTPDVEPHSGTSYYFHVTKDATETSYSQTYGQYYQSVRCMQD